MARRVIGFNECDSPDEVQKLMQELFDNQELIDNKVCLLQREIEAMKTKPEKKEVKPEKKKKNEGKIIMKTLIGLILFAILLFVGLSQAVYVATDITQEIAGNPIMLDQYLRDSFANQTANYYTFTPTDTAPTASEGRVYYNNSANTLELYNGTAWVTIDVASGVSLDSAYNLGSAVTVDTSAITLTAGAGTNNEVLALVQSNTGNYSAMSITNAGAYPAIQITGSSTGDDITGTSSLWTVSEAGVGTFAGLIVGATDIVLENSEKIENGTDSKFEFDNGAEDLTIDLSQTNIIAITSDTSAVTFDFGALDTIIGVTAITGEASDFTISTTGNATGEDLIISQAGTGDNQVIIQSAGTAANAIAIQSSKGIDIDAVDDLTISCTSSTTADDLVIEQIGANNSSVLIKAAGTGTDAISAIATAGGVVISGIDDVGITCASTTTADDLTINQTGAVNASILLNAAGTGADAIGLNASGSGGGIALATAAGAVTITAVGATAGDITLTAGDDLFLAVTGDVNVTPTGDVHLGGATLTNYLINVEVVTTQTRTLTARESGKTLVSSYTGTQTYTLPDAAAGLFYIFIDNSATAANDVVIDCASGDNIDGDTNGDAIESVTDALGQNIILMAVDGTRWVTISKVGTWAAQ